MHFKFLWNTNYFSWVNNKMLVLDRYKHASLICLPWLRSDLDCSHSEVWGWGVYDRMVNNRVAGLGHSMAANIFPQRKMMWKCRKCVYDVPNHFNCKIHCKNEREREIMECILSIHQKYVCTTVTLFPTERQRKKKKYFPLICFAWFWDVVRNFCWNLAILVNSIT